MGAGVSTAGEILAGKATSSRDDVSQLLLAFRGQEI